MERIVERVVQTIPKQPKVKKVAAYARVSSGKDAMLHSLSAQVSYYSSYIQRHSGWLYCGVYSDEAITGTKENRPGFQNLLTECRNGNVDLIITKSISRFARNTITLLAAVRELKKLGVDVYFEEQNIHSLSAEGELMLTILASYAQEESRSASENQKWKIRHKYELGIPNSMIIFGYRFENGTLVIEPNEAEIVRMVYADYLSGMGINKIVKKLISLNIPTKKNCEWHENIISEMLRNEKYKGDLLLQKAYNKDHISKQTVKNNGELPMFYVENAHEAIIDKDTFQRVQDEIARRSNSRKGIAPKTYIYTGKIRCEKCGKNYRRITANGVPKWQCHTYNARGKKFCDSKAVPESVLNGIVGKKPFKEISIPEHGVIKVTWADGTQSIHEWENTSRSASWTEEMKQAAREKTMERIRKKCQEQ